MFSFLGMIVCNASKFVFKLLNTFKLQKILVVFLVSNYVLSKNFIFMQTWNDKFPKEYFFNDFMVNKSQ